MNNMIIQPQLLQQFYHIIYDRRQDIILLGQMVPFFWGGPLVCPLTCKAWGGGASGLFPVVFKQLLLLGQHIVGLYFEEDCDGMTNLKTVGETKPVIVVMMRRQYQDQCIHQICIQDQCIDNTTIDYVHLSFQQKVAKSRPIYIYMKF